MQRRDQYKSESATTITRTQHSSRTVTSTQTIKSSGGSSSSRRNEGKSSSVTQQQQPPASLNLWGRRSEDHNSLITGSLSSLGLQQMSGYDDLDVMQRQAPMEWADDDDSSSKGRGKTSAEPVSSIAFPVSPTPPAEETAGLQHGMAGRSEGARFNSLPARQPFKTKAQQRVPRHSTLTGRPVLAEQSSNAQSSHLFSPDSSGYSTPEVNGGRQLSLRQRSIKSLQGIASAWVPAAVRSPYDSENDTESSALQKNKEKEAMEKRPIKLDRRRLNKAVSLAVEAAQASEQDQRAWKLRRKRLARQQAAMKKIEESKASSDSSRFASLPWRRSPRTAPKSLAESDGDAKQGALVAYKSRGSLSGDEEEEVQEDGLEDDDDSSSQNTKRPGFPGDDLSTEDSDESEADVVPDDFSVDLYVSSLSYLLTALSPKDVENVGEKHREEMKRKLEEALRNLERNQTASEAVSSTSDREEVIRLRVERELAMMEQAYYQRQGGASSSASRVQQAARASSEERIRKQSVAGYLASSAIDLGLSVGAGALAAASRGVASLVPMLTADDSGNKGGRGEMETLRPTSIEEISDSEDALPSTSSSSSKMLTRPRSAKMEEKSPPILTHSQWELTRTLAHSVASTMYNNLAAVAEQRRQDGPGSSSSAAAMSSDVAVYRPAGSALATRTEKTDDASDQLLIMAATLARNVKRSPLPSQVRALTSQVVSLIGALDERYSISKRSADVALRKTGQALYYVRKNDLHVKALRAVWAIIEASVAAVEAYRDEEEWKGDLALQQQQQHRGIEAKAIEARPASR